MLGFKNMSRLERQEAVSGITFAAPFIIGMIVFTSFPFIASLYLSFTNYDMISTPKWIGLQNYKILFTKDPLFYTSLWNTLFHVVVSTPLGIIVGIALALLLNSKVKGISVYRTMYYLPNVVSIVAMAFLWMWIFQPNFGLINQILGFFGIEGPGWYMDNTSTIIPKLTLILMGLWTAGGSMVIYLAALQDIPGEIYEAALLDGAGYFRKLFKITLPLITPTIFFNLITTVIGGFQMFTLSYIMTNGGPGTSTYYFGYYLYNKAFSDYQMGMASAMSWLLLAITMLITWIIFKSSKRWVFYLGE
ncbi:sugar ABC transporter permease [Clostridium swellfunianum]|uniref:carbohydrate ABC transporter permease n=1 Tax=Clostridium swellfunianum TaxID=1367462 RepID=UPI00202FE3E5|nr:sugar ABC transporter permease [Clostridium swellfunianum]MCM0647308.1 sugar ABC transporter permease [Clostridium swellfunianum]